MKFEWDAAKAAANRRKHGVSFSYMSKQHAKISKSKSVHDDYELPKELDMSKLRFVGIALEVLERHVARKKTTVQLDPDVARVFDTSDSVNAVLRAIIQSLTLKGKHRKSA